MSHSWEYDAPTGVYKNNNLSSQVRHAAIADTKFMQFVHAEPGYGKKKGESVTIKRISNLTVPTSGKIAENQRIPEDDLTITTISITVSEWGRSVPYTSLSEDLGSLDIKNVVQKNLKDQMSLVMDSAAAAAFKEAKVKAIPTGVSALTFDTDGTPSSTAVANLNLYHVERIRDYMFSTLNIPTFEGDDYVALVSTKAKRGIINDPKFEQWKLYTTPEAKFNAELGRLENIRFVEINNTNSLSGSKGSGGVLGEALFFGSDAVAMAVVEDPELRAKTPEDYGRQMGVAWYGILEFGIIWDTANAGEARIIHVTSA